MKPYLLIRNTGLAPLESFTILGLSTAHGREESIGQFGTGSKQGTLALMRAGIIPRIFIGNEELVFSTHPAKMGEKDYSEVRYTFRGEQHKTGTCLEFGALDWTKPTMAIREFVCNALDQGEKIGDCICEADSPEPHPDETRVYIPADNPDICDYWRNIGNYFLHYDRLENTPIIEARSTNAQFFRRGVFVTERSGYKHPALFGYNFHDGRIDESRNMDGNAMGNVAVKLLLTSPDHIEKIFRSFGGHPKWEHDLGNAMWDIGASAAQSKANIAEAWKRVYGEKPFSSSITVSTALQKKGIAYAIVPDGWGYTLRSAGIQDGEKMLTELEQDQAEICEPTESAVATFERCWKWIESARLTANKPFPRVQCFTLPMKNGRERMGFFRDGTVFLNLEYDTNEAAALEELAHYVTGAEDETRDFQDWAFKLALRLAKLRSGVPDTPAPAPVLRTSYFTFGQCHSHELGGRTFGPMDVVKITAEDPRARMVDLFGIKWSMEYDAEPRMELFPGGITDLS